MMRLYISLVFLMFFSCDKYGEDGDGNGNLKIQMLKEECTSKTNIMSILFMHPETTTNCFMVYDDEKFTGTAVEYHSNGNLKLITTYIEGYENSESRKEYFDNGQIVNEVIRTTEDITYKTYYSNGEVDEIKYESLLNSSFDFEKTFHKNGNLKTHYENGKRQEFFENGDLKFDNIQLEGNNFIHVEYFSNKQLKHKEIRDDLFEFREVYNEHGDIIELFNNDSIHIKNNPKTLAKVFNGTYKNRMKDGEWTYFFENGNIKSVGSYSEGMKIGSHVYYHENRQLLKKVNYVNGDISGKLKVFFDNGRLKSKANYNEGDLHGKFLEYHENGILKTEGNYENGHKIGLFKFYDKKGSLESAETY